MGSQGVKDGESRSPGSQDGETYPAHDVRESGGKVHQGEVTRSRRRGPDICGVCYGVCCGAARELVGNLHRMGAIGVFQQGNWWLRVNLVVFYLFIGF